MHFNKKYLEIYDISFHFPWQILLNLFKEEDFPQLENPILRYEPALELYVHWKILYVSAYQ